MKSLRLARLQHGKASLSLNRGGVGSAGRGKSLVNSVHTVVLIRHGESVWNKTPKRFTGWCDVPLTEHGEADARDAGRLMGERSMKFDVMFTSTLERAWRTGAIALSESGQSGCEVVRSWKLNERHYGALQGHKKDCPHLIKHFGQEQLIDFRRSYDTAPPSLQDKGIAVKLRESDVITSNSLMDVRYVGNSKYPQTESLKDCERRAFGYWEEVIAPRVKQGERVLIVAHANTIRALVKAVDKIDDNMIKHLKIPNGVPLVYTLDKNLTPILESADDMGFEAKYLISAHNHSKVRTFVCSIET